MRIKYIPNGKRKMTTVKVGVRQAFKAIVAIQRIGTIVKVR